jgi:hypothetical protein
MVDEDLNKILSKLYFGLPVGFLTTTQEAHTIVNYAHTHMNPVTCPQDDSLL